MKITLDYDATYTADRHLWNNFIQTCRMVGHEVFIITARSPVRDKNDELRMLETKMPVYYCDGVAKRWWCMHNGPGKVDIWIDDKPDNIIANSAFPFDELQVWRQGCAATEPGHAGTIPFDHAAQCDCGFCFKELTR